MGTQFINATRFDAMIVGVSENSSNKESLLRDVLTLVRSAYSAGAISSEDFDSLTGRGLNKLGQFGM